MVESCGCDPAMLSTISILDSNQCMRNVASEHGVRYTLPPATVRRLGKRLVVQASTDAIRPYSCIKACRISPLRNIAEYPTAKKTGICPSICNLYTLRLQGWKSLTMSNCCWLVFLGSRVWQLGSLPSRDVGNFQHCHFWVHRVQRWVTADRFLSVPSRNAMHIRQWDPCHAF